MLCLNQFPIDPGIRCCLLIRASSHGPEWFPHGMGSWVLRPFVPGLLKYTLSIVQSRFVRRDRSEPCPEDPGRRSSRRLDSSGDSPDCRYKDAVEGIPGPTVDDR